MHLEKSIVANIFVLIRHNNNRPYPKIDAPNLIKIDEKTYSAT